MSNTVSDQFFCFFDTSEYPNGDQPSKGIRSLDLDLQLTVFKSHFHLKEHRNNVEKTSNDDVVDMMVRQLAARIVRNSEVS